MQLPVLEKFERTPSSGYYLPARVGRSGVLVYQRKDGTTFREFRPADEAFAARSLASLADAVVTVGHPPDELVSPANFRKYSAGHVRGAGRRDGQFIAGELAVQDEVAIAGLASRALSELSCGYTCVLDPTPGLDSETGERYDAIQRDVVYNHVALLPPGTGRAGPGAKVALDGATAGSRIDGLEVSAEPARHARVDVSHQIEARSDSMKEWINGREYTVGTPEWAAAHALRMKRLDELEEKAKEEEVEEGDLKSKLDALTKERDELKGQVDSMKAKLDELTKKLGESEDETKMDAKLAERGRVVDAAKRVLGTEAKTDSKTSDAIRREVLVKLDGADVVLDGEKKPLTADIVRVMFDARIRGLPATPGFAPPVRTDSYPTAPGLPTGAPTADPRGQYTPPGR